MRAAVEAALVVTLGSAASRAQAMPTDPLEFYQSYLAVLAKARTLDELLPYYTSELAQGLGKMPKEMQGNYLKMNARQLTDLKVTKQSVTASKAEFQMTAKTRTGTETTGAARLVKEKGVWKVEDESWATQVP